jgi:HD-GYP domain-containing protein (c-di-GMP phosphodiesterase class II)
MGVSNRPGDDAGPGTEQPILDYAGLLTILNQANRIASTTSLIDLLEQMIDLMIEVSGATNGTLYLLDHEANELVFMVVRGNAEDQRLAGKRIKANMGIVGASIQHGQPIVIPDLASDPRWYREFNPELAKRLRNAITLPLLMQAKPIGAVQIFNYVCAQIELLQVLANRMASEVDKALLLEKTQRSNRRLEELVEVLGRVGAVLDRDELLDLLTEYASQLLAAESSKVYLVETAGESGAALLSKSSTSGVAPAIIPSKDEKQDYSFMARSAVSAPLRARPILVGKEGGRLEERVIGHLMALNKQHGVFDSEDNRLLEILASQASTVLQIAVLYGQANELFLDFIKALASAIDAKDPYTQGHSRRVSEYSIAIAQALGLQGDTLRDIHIGSLLHDIGKIGIPDNILGKPGKLDEAEYDQMKKHPGIGFKIMEQVHLLHHVLPAIIEHHERLDGSGYPMGLHGEQVSQMGRIVAVADVYDALTTDRPYRKAMDTIAALDLMHKDVDTRFDSRCIQALIQLATSG